MNKREPLKSNPFLNLTLLLTLVITIYSTKDSLFQLGKQILPTKTFANTFEVYANDRPTTTEPIERPDLSKEKLLEDDNAIYYIPTDNELNSADDVIEDALVGYTPPKPLQPINHSHDSITGENVVMPLLNDYTNYDLTEPCGFTEEELELILPPAMKGMAHTFLETELYGFNAVGQICLARLESGGGTSRIAREKHNYFGYQAYDRSAYESATSANSFEEHIFKTMPLIVDSYLNSEGKYFHGCTLSGMNVCYCTNKEWANMISDMMVDSVREIYEYKGITPLQ